MTALISAFAVVEQEEDGNRDDGVGTGADEFVGPQEMKIGKVQKAVVDEKKQDAVDDGEAEGDDNSGQRAFDVHLKPNACSDIANCGFGHSIDTNGLVGEGVLKQSDDRSGEGSGDGAAAGDGEKKDDDEGKIEDGKARKWFREKGLEENRHQRHEYRDDGREGVLLEFSAGSVAVGGHFFG